jgi:hypothetical protein
MQEVFDVDPDDGFPFLGDAVDATDLRALFKPGTINTVTGLFRPLRPAA